MKGLFPPFLLPLLFCGLSCSAFSLSEKEIHDQSVLKYRTTAEKVYEEHVKIKFHNRPIGTDGSPVLDPYGMQHFPLKDKSYDIFCYFRRSGLPEVLLLFGEKLYLYKETTDSSNINKGTRDLFSRLNKEGFYNNLHRYFNESPLEDDTIQANFETLKLSEDLKNMPFTYKVKEKTISAALASKLITTWKNLKDITPRETNKIQAYENIFGVLDIYHHYHKATLGMSCFDDFLIMRAPKCLTKPTKNNARFNNLMYLRQASGEDATLYELGCENKPFGIILPPAAYTEDSIPHQTANFLELIRNEIDTPSTENFEAILEEKRTALDDAIKNSRQPHASSSHENEFLSHYYKVIETIFEKDYKPDFSNMPFFLEKTNIPFYYGWSDPFENNIFAAFQKTGLDTQEIFCASNFDNTSAQAFCLKGNTLTIYSTDLPRKKNLDESLNRLEEQMAALALQNPNATPEQNRNTAEKIIHLLQKHHKTKESRHEYVISHNIKLPPSLAADLKNTWKTLAALHDDGPYMEVYKNHFPRLFGMDLPESRFQACMKEENCEDIANPPHYMMSLLGYKGTLFALNMPSRFYLSSEIPYQINTVISQTYLLNQQNTEENRKSLKSSLSELRVNLKKALAIRKVKIPESAPISP